MANIMSQLKLRNKPSRDGFDLSRKNAFTAKIGELLPVACLEVVPGDSFKGKIEHFTRTMPVNTAAYTRMREYYDWFFVPTNLLWNKFNSWVMINQNINHADGITGNDNTADTFSPRFTCAQVASYLKSVSQDASAKYNIFNFDRAKCSAKLLHYLGYGDYYQSAVGGDQTFRYNTSLNPFPLLAYQKIYQDFYRNSQWEDASPQSFNIDYLGMSNHQIPVSDLLETAPTQENMFDLRYCNWNKDLFMGVLPNSQYGEAASVIGDDGTGTFNLGSYGTFRGGGVYVEGTESTAQGVVVPADNTYLQTNDGRSAKILIGSSQSTPMLANALGLNSATISDIQAKFGILALRQAEALQKWKEVTQSQFMDYKNQVEAHFGVSPSNALSERCQWIEGSVSSLDISEVTNTNITGGAAADIAGKGVGVGSGGFKFKSDVHGYLICIYHCMPLLDYASDGIKKMNWKTYRTDYFIPELDKCGMVSLPTVELTNSPNNPTFTPLLLGYLPRYYDYKTAVDEVHGAFYNGTDDMTGWVAPVDQSYITKYIESLHGDADSINYKWFKVNPAVLNPIFAADVDSDVTTDQLLVNCSLDIKASRPMDRNGLPY